MCPTEFRHASRLSFQPCASKKSEIRDFGFFTSAYEALLDVIDDRTAPDASEDVSSNGRILINPTVSTIEHIAAFLVREFTRLLFIVRDLAAVLSIEAPAYRLPLTKNSK